MRPLPRTSKPEASQAFTIILERLYAMARQTDASLGSPSDLEATLIALPSENRSQVMLVLESVESRATTRADQELADAARLVRNIAGRVWKHQGLDTLARKIEPRSYGFPNG
ncbi:hypothetical protein [Microvirga arabica]|uniref:hypothetical protein n=1 Tax=Microvirga arabica TaxID=1128671 RepID=UPI0019396CF1|nr:hypothetical protein [Microvirga arabica]MBM1172218.1 hypothetical protein [Microvirga arabica]